MKQYPKEVMDRMLSMDLKEELRKHWVFLYENGYMTKEEMEKEINEIHDSVHNE